MQAYQRLDFVPSKALIAYVTVAGKLRIGYAYRSGPVVLVSFLRGREIIRSVVVPTRTVVVFMGKSTSKKEHELIVDDFGFDWLTEQARSSLGRELGGTDIVSEWGDYLDQVVEKLYDQPIQRLRDVLTLLNSPPVT